MDSRSVLSICRDLQNVYRTAAVIAAKEQRRIKQNMIALHQSSGDAARRAQQLQFFARHAEANCADRKPRSPHFSLAYLLLSHPFPRVCPFFFLCLYVCVCVFVVVRKIDEQIRELSAAVGKLALLADALAAVLPAARAPQMPPPLAAVLAAARGGWRRRGGGRDRCSPPRRIGSRKAHGAAEPSAALAAEWNPANIQTASVSAPAAIAAVAAAAAAAGFANAVELRDDHDTDALLLDDDDATTTANMAETRHHRVVRGLRRHALKMEWNQSRARLLELSMSSPAARTARCMRCRLSSC
jgi:hypothetical protein